MSHVLTLVSSNPENPLSEEYTRQAAGMVESNGLRIAGPTDFFAPDKAADIAISAEIDLPLMFALREHFENAAIDVFCVEIENRVKSLGFFDMDSTIINGETLDDMAALAGVGDEVAAITKKTMEEGGDFQESLRRRLPMLKGHVAQDLIEQTLAAMKPNDGAETLIRTLKANGAECFLFSGGFTSHTGVVYQKLGFTDHRANILDIDDEGLLTGKVVNDKDIVDGAKKASLAREFTEKYGKTLQQCLAMGDGSNDIPMMKQAGLGIGFRPKNGSVVEKEMLNIIRHGDLSTALYAMGLTPE